MLLEGALTERVIGSAIEAHRRLGPGLPESAYESCEVSFVPQVCGIYSRKGRGLCGLSGEDRLNQVLVERVG